MGCGQGADCPIIISSLALQTASKSGYSCIRLAMTLCPMSRAQLPVWLARIFTLDFLMTSSKPAFRLAAADDPGKPSSSITEPLFPSLSLMNLAAARPSLDIVCDQLDQHPLRIRLVRDDRNGDTGLCSSFDSRDLRIGGCRGNQNAMYSFGNKIAQVGGLSRLRPLVTYDHNPRSEHCGRLLSPTLQRGKEGVLRTSVARTEASGRVKLTRSAIVLSTSSA